MFFIWILTFVVVCACVALHYEMLNFISRLLPKLPVPRRRRVTVAMLGLIVTHIVEIYLFAIAMYVVEVKAEGEQLIAGSSAIQMIAEQSQLDADAPVEPEKRVFTDAIYLSFTTFTSLGYGDIVPVGDLRVLAAVEVLTGLLTIAWSASFIFMEMMRVWNDEPEKGSEHETVEG